MTIFLKYFIGVSTFYLLLTLFGQDNIAWYFKPLLLPFLILTAYKSAGFTTKKWLLFALLFSWIGDVILLFADKGELYFILGLVSFLTAHILFIFLFTKQEIVTKQKSNMFWLGIVGVLIYLCSMLTVLYPKLGGLKMPVTVYALTISIMLVMAIIGYFSWKKPMNLLIFVGALFFVTSDSILALNKFHNPIPCANFLIMFTYIVAQYLITTGILKLNTKN